MKTNTLLLFLVLIIVLNACKTQQTVPANNSSMPTISDAERTVHQPNLQPLVMKVINKKTYLGYDDDYVNIISKPSPWLSDFFGIQAINTLTKEEITQDFVPKFASVVRNQDNQLELQFNEGYKATFYVRSSLSIAGNIIPTDHVFFNDSTFQLFTANIDKFKKLLTTQKLEQKYLISNPYFREEQLVYNKMSSSITTPVEADAAAFNSSTKDAVLIYPDPSHGDYAYFQKMHDFVKTANFDWFGLEMLSVDSQKAINDFIASPEGTNAYKAAEQHLTKVYEKGWLFKYKGDKPTENPFITLFKTLKQRGKKVYAIENDNLAYLIFRFGETPFGGAVRSALWAERIPTSGKGIVFGGSAHFKQKDGKNINFQDFYKDKNKNVLFYRPATL